MADRTGAAETTVSQNTNTAGRPLDRAAYLHFPAEENETGVTKTFLHNIALDGAYEPPYRRLDWVRVQDARQDWNFEADASRKTENSKPGMFLDDYFGNSRATLEAILLWMKPSEQKVAQRRQRYYDRMLVVPPSMTSSCRSVMPGSLIFPRVIHP